ncbi:MAG: hypothetical protein IJ678_08820, partial [Kiritimatiellae bacterium]|nr:hypothetical protein [Kiritimatiellia bacterium]
MKNTRSLFLSAAVAAAFCAGCASDLTGYSYDRGEARAQHTVYYGTITHIEGAIVEGDPGIVGGIAGAVVGGLLGNTIGGGHGRDL